jgi:hypothetical protein
MADFDFDTLLSNAFGGGGNSEIEKLLSSKQKDQLNMQATLAAAAQLLQAGGRSSQRIGLGQALGSALQAGQGAYEKGTTNAFQQVLLGEKLKEGQRAAKAEADFYKLFEAPQGAAAAPMQPLTGVAVPPIERFIQETTPAPINPLANLSPQQMALVRTLGREKGTQYLLESMKPQETVGQPFQGQDGKFYIQTKTGGVIPAPIAPAAKPSGPPQQVLGAGNKPALVQYYDDGTYKQVSGVSPLIPPEKVDTGGGIQFIDPYSQKIGSVIPKTLAPQVVGNAEDGFFVLGGGGGGGARPRPAAAPAVAGQAPTVGAAAPAPAAAGPVPLIPGTGKSYAREKDLRATFTTEMKPFTDLAQAFRKVEAAALNPSAAGDISLVYGYMKILDPGSTVMQGEQATAANAGGVQDRIRALYNKALTGETLADNVRQDFYAQSRNLIESQRPLQQDISERYGLIATQNKLDPNQIVFDPFKRIRTPAEIAAEAAKEKEKKKKPASYNNTYNLLPRN